MTTEHIEYSPISTRPTPEIAGVIQGLLKMTDGLVTVHAKDSAHACVISEHLRDIRRVSYIWEPVISNGRVEHINDPGEKYTGD